MKITSRESTQLWVDNELQSSAHRIDYGCRKISLLLVRNPQKYVHYIVYGCTTCMIISAFDLDSRCAVTMCLTPGVTWVMHPDKGLKALCGSDAQT
eukprot:5097190-Amphidinium_carterae.1